MISDYIASCMQKAHYELIEKGTRYYGEIPGVQGVWACEKTLEECRAELASVLEDWLVLCLRNNFSIPGFFVSKRQVKEKTYA